MMRRVKLNRTFSGFIQQNSYSAASPCCSSNFVESGKRYVMARLHNYPQHPPFKCGRRNPGWQFHSRSNGIVGVWSLLILIWLEQRSAKAFPRPRNPPKHSIVVWFSPNIASHFVQPSKKLSNSRLRVIVGQKPRRQKTPSFRRARWQQGMRRRVFPAPDLNRKR